MDEDKKQAINLAAIILQKRINELCMEFQEYQAKVNEIELELDHLSNEYELLVKAL